MKFNLFFTFIILMMSSLAFSQEKKKVSFKDEEDEKFDLSEWIIEANGFVPIPSIITEPALGNIGGSLGLIFIKQNPGSTPNITALMGGYTANKTWFIGGFHSHNIPEKGIKFRFGTLYSNLNISLFREIPDRGEREFKLNFRTLPVFGRFTKKIKDGPFEIGVQYVYANMRIKTQFTELPEFIEDKNFNSNISSLGPIVIVDNRDNVFTPDKGFYGELKFNVSHEYILSDYNYNKLNLTVINYSKLNEKWILGLRGVYQQIFNDPPFFLLPGIDLRGVPTARYQGEITSLFEMEHRYDLVPRWSLVGFGGIAKAFNGYSAFSDAPVVYNYGLGSRYLVARKFNLRMGVDVARGPEDWAWYIVFGSNWLR